MKIILLVIFYTGFVIGGWCFLKPVPIKELKKDASLLYQLPANVFFFLDRLLNVTLWQLLIYVTGQHRRTLWQWETISGRQGRDFKGCLPTVVIDFIALDWDHGTNKGHCQKYIGI